MILEGILALHDPRIFDMLDMKIFVEADADLCLSRRSKIYLWALSGELRADVEASKSSAMSVKEAERSKASLSNGLLT